MPMRLTPRRTDDSAARSSTSSAAQEARRHPSAKLPISPPLSRETMGQVTPAARTIAPTSSPIRLAELPLMTASSAGGCAMYG